MDYGTTHLTILAQKVECKHLSESGKYKEGLRAGVDEDMGWEEICRLGQKICCHIFHTSIANKSLVMTAGLLETLVTLVMTHTGQINPVHSHA